MKIKDMYGFVQLKNNKVEVTISEEYSDYYYYYDSSYIRAIKSAKRILKIIENQGKIWVVDTPPTQNTFMVVDVETANPAHSSICQIGIAVFQNNQLIDQWESLVNPQQPFQEYNSSIHGISAKDVENAPTLAELSDFLVTQYFQKYPATCYGSFDRVAFDSALPEILNIDWLDITQMVRRTWHEFSQKGYGLANMSTHLGIPLKTHHNALSDAITAGQILINAFNANGLNIDDWRNGKLPAKAAKLDSQALCEPNADGYLYGKSIVFTGELSIPRITLEQFAMQVGLAPKSSVSSKTDYLVNGVQTSSKIKDGMSSKMKKALEINSKANQIQILTEQDFFDLINQEQNDN